MDGVAARAGVSKATIYLRYEGKADLATAALAHLRESGRPAATGDLRADLVAQLRQLRRNAERVSAMPLIGTCLTEEQHTPELLRLFRERTLRPRRALLRKMLDEAARSGAIAPDRDIDAAVRPDDGCLPVALPLGRAVPGRLGGADRRRADAGAGGPPPRVESPA